MPEIKVETNSFKRNNVSKKYKCCICGETYEKEIWLYAHITGHSQEIVSCGNKWSENSRGTRSKTSQNKENQKVSKKRTRFSQDSRSTEISLLNEMNCSDSSQNEKFDEKPHSIVDNFKCSICGQIFQNEDDLEDHASGHAEKNYECDSCKKCFRSKKLILLHLVRTHLDEVKKNKELKKTDKENKKRKNTRKKKLERPYKCDEENCHYATSQVCLLKAHKFRHNPFYKCVTCQEKFKSRAELNSHMSSHGERPYKCDQCQKWYKDKQGLRWHKKVQHDPSRLKFTCELCGKTYPFDSLLTQHINLSHATERQAVCDICGKNVRKTYLLMHRRTHGEKQYSCDVCERKFVGKAYLKKHKMIHTGEKPYVCCVCGKLFRQQNTLTIHMRTHTGDRPYKCVLCDNAYKTHDNLKKHYRRSGHKMV